MIFTFYSYKGGVGRSMALANVAQWLHREGACVAMVDWDLEAPGLENYFYASAEEIEDVRERPGLVDLLAAYRENFRKTTRENPKWTAEQIFAKAVGTLPPFRTFLHRIGDGAAKGELYLLPAGSRSDRAARPEPAAATEEDVALTKEEIEALLREVTNGTGEAPPRSAAPVPADDDSRDTVEPEPCAEPSAPPRTQTFAEYAAAVQDFDWPQFFADLEGERFFAWFREQLTSPAAVGADAVLIDSRTGVTEMGGVCTRLLADVVVSFCASNQQNLAGSIKMARSFRRPEILGRRDGKPEVMIVPSRVEEKAETEDLGRFRTEFQQKEREFPTGVFPFAQGPAGEESLSTAWTSTQSFWTLQIPYYPRFSFQEALTFDAPGTHAKVIPLPEMQRVYTKLACYVALHAPESGSLRRKLLPALQREVPQLLGRVQLLYEEDGREIAAALRGELARRGVALGEDAGPAESRTAALEGARAVVAVLTPKLTRTAGLAAQWRVLRRRGRRLYLAGGMPDKAAPAWDGRVYDPITDIGDLANDLLQAAAAVPAPNMAPPPSELHIDRPEVRRALKSALLKAAGTKTLSTVAVCGFVGMGKSTLARQVCHDPEVEDAFGGGILWLKLGPEPDLRPQFEEAVYALTGRRASCATEGDARAQLAEAVGDRNLLVVLDGVCKPEDMNRLPSPRAAQVRLVLTRDAEVAASAGGFVVNIPVMAEDECARVLALAAGQPDAGPFRGLAARLYGWPALVNLCRSELQQFLARRMTIGEAVRSAEAQLERHGVTAFDESRERSETAGGQIRDAIGSAGPEALEIVVRLARSGAEDGPATPSRKAREQEAVRRLTALGLVFVGPNAVHPIVREYLAAGGWLNESKAPGSGDRRFKTHKDAATNPDVRRAKEMLHAGRVAESAGTVKGLIQALKAARYFGYARQVAALARWSPEIAKSNLGLWLAQQQALCTYKDVDLAADERLDRALRILNDADPLERTACQETLGIAGAIYKAKYELNQERRDMECALDYYTRGYEFGIAGDYGYNAINAAFALDMLAHEEEAACSASRGTDGRCRAGSAETGSSASGSGGTSRLGRGTGDATGPKSGVVGRGTGYGGSWRRQKARQIRIEIVDTLRPMARSASASTITKEWWFPATLAEACFGLGAGEDGKPDERWYEEARFWIREALAGDLADWEFESTARQFSRLAHVQGASGGEGSAATRTLRVLLGDQAAAESVETGKIGLALSGGGFRAALFHIGMLAKLAEADVLRRVEVLSCVSGGSIIGAHYYLAVRKLLQEKADEEITREDYLAIVRDIEDRFLEGVEGDLRNRLFADPVSSLRSVFSKGFSQTHRLADMFESALFQKGGNPPLYLNELTIQPKDAPPDFAPKLDNWRRRAKAPVLILNATTLNTGHNWQFTATWMGEPPGGVTSEIDANERFERMYYWEAPEQYRKLRLGLAVAASAAVPGLFDPIEMDGLFEGRKVRLADGGVHDNQGVAGLLDQDCTVLFVSDASGQMFTETAPPAGHMGVPLRATSISQERVRSAEYRELAARRRSGLLRGLGFIHLTKGLPATDVAWIGADEAPEPPDNPDAKPGMESKGLPATIQRRLAELRTDLDAFTEREAYALMLSAYRMTEGELQRALPGAAQGKPELWRFLQIRDMAESADTRLDRALEIGACRFGKPWKLWAGLKALGTFAALAALAEAGWYALVKTGPFPAELARTALRAGAYGVGGAFALYLLAWLAARIRGARKAPSQIALGLLLGTVGWLGFRLYLWLLHPFYLRMGRVKQEAAGRSPLPGAVAALTAAALVLGGVALARKGNPWSAEFAHERAVESAAAGDLAAASRFWARLVRLHPSDPRASAGLGDVRWREGERARGDALRSFGAAVLSGTEDPAPYARRGDAALGAGQWKQASYAFAEAVRIMPENGVFYVRLGDALLCQGKFAEAATAYRNAASFQPELKPPALPPLEQALAKPAATPRQPAVQSERAIQARPDAAIPSAARLYVQVSDDGLRGVVDAVRRDLEGPDLIIPPTETVRLKSPPASELRFFFPEDQAEAERVRDRLAKAGLPVQVRGPLSGGGRARRRHFELWLTRDLPALQGPEQTGSRGAKW